MSSDEVIEAWSIGLSFAKLLTKTVHLISYLDLYRTRVLRQSGSILNMRLIQRSARQYREICKGAAQ
jgi:hypothetical protein